MKLALSVRFPVPLTGTIHLPKTPVQSKPPRVGHHSLPFHPKIRLLLLAFTTAKFRRNKSLIVKAIEESKSQESTDFEADVEPDSGKEPVASGSSESGTELSELGAEIKKAMEQRKEEKREGDLFSGVAEEVKEIEWPAFRKVLGTTGVVLGVIAGSSVVLLTVNAVLAELSDRVFAGRGVQDFFS